MFLEALNLNTFFAPRFKLGWILILIAAINAFGWTLFRWNYENSQRGAQITVDYDDLWREPATRVVVRAPGVDVAHFDAVVRAMGLQDVTYAIGYTAWLDLTGPGVSKGSALEELRVQLGVDAAHTVAVGDGTNDVWLIAGAPGPRYTAPLALI